MTRKQKNNKYVFLDRDGVLVKDKRHIHKIEDLEMLPGVIEGLQSFKNAGFKFIVVTNQAGIAKGHFKHEDVHAFNEELRKRLAKKNITIDAFYICPHHPHHTGECLCRKPKTGMLEQAALDFSVSPSNTILIGDKDSDIETGRRWGCKTLRIKNDQYPRTVKADYEASDLVEAALIAEKLY